MLPLLFNRPMPTHIYTAEWVLPVSSPPIHKGAIAVRDDKIAFVGSQTDIRLIPEFDRQQPRDFGRAAILPGLVNVHSHLELTVMRGFLEDLAFREWITKLTRTKYEQLTPADLQNSARLGAAEAIRAGITTLADTGDGRSAFDALRESGLRGIAYRELFGPIPADANQSLAGLKQNVDEMRRTETALVRVGVSPHAPYTVSPRLFTLVARYAIEESLDICIHAAESQAERELISVGAGAFADGLKQRGIEWSPAGQSTIEFLQSIGVLDAAPLLVHCVTVDESDIGLLKSSKSRVAHCPKSNAKLGHGVAPLKTMMDHGVRIGLGTDSVASNNRCDLISEARFCCLIHRAVARDFTRPSASDMLRLMTLGGAEALGLQREIGSLETGKAADLTVIDLSRAHNAPLHDPIAAVVFSIEASDVTATIVSGKVLFENDEVRTLDEGDIRETVEQAVSRMH